MTTDAAIFVPREASLHDLASLFRQSNPQGVVESASAVSIQLLSCVGSKEYAEVTDASLSGNEPDDFPKVWEQNGEPPEDATYCASPGFLKAIGSRPKQISLWGNPRDFVKSVLMSFTEDDRIWVMMNNGKITHGAELRQALLTNVFFDAALPW